MMKKSKMLRFLSLSVAAAGFLLIAGNVMPASAQRDPFGKPSWAQPRDPNAKPIVVNKDGKVTVVKPVPPAPSPVIPPGIQERINYYKRLRETAVASNQPIPKVTSVLTLDEMAVVGIFRTPRGYAAMVEAKPIKLSYTIYPGEKFFDGQLVAIEENKLVFRRVTKWTNGKFIASEESKALRQYTVEQEVNGTAPVETTTTAKTETTTAPATTQSQTPVNTAENKPQPSSAPAQIVSPLDEMSRQPVENPQDAKKSTDKNKKGKQKSSVKPAEKKAVKVAENKQQ
jgi:hypothetical protein